VPDWDSLKLDLSVHILPGDVQDIRLNRVGYDLKPADLILRISSRPAIDPGSVRNNGFFVWLHRVDAVKPNMRAGRTTGTFFVLQKNCQNFNRLEGSRRPVTDFHQHSRLSVHKPDDERRCSIVACHKFQCLRFSVDLYLRGFLQQPRQKSSQLIKIIRVRQVYVSIDCDFFTFADVLSAKDYNWNLVTTFMSSSQYLPII
jgi:hypothetical protein